VAAVRVVLVTGKGGTGKTTVAAATAVRAADLGCRTLLVSSDAAHSLSDVLGLPIGARPTSITGQLSAEELDAQTLLDESWSTIREYLQDLLMWAGADEVQAGELAVVPGLEELLALRAISARVSEDWDAVIVDCAPTAETVRLLALPATIRTYLERVLPAHRRLARTVAPILRRRASMPPAPTGVLDAVLALVDDVQGLHETIADPRTTEVRLVTTPESMVVAETRRLRAYLELFDFAVGTLVINRVSPMAPDDPWLAEVQRAQAPHLRELHRLFPDLDPIQAPMRPSEIRGLDELNRFARAIYGARDPLAGSTSPAPSEAASSMANTMRIRLPGVSREDVKLARVGATMLVTVGSFRRSLSVPQHLRGEQATAARIVDGHLEVEFGPA
jgi:arsenite/tail-anchored protein-transporting ATPase